MTLILVRGKYEKTVMDILQQTLYKNGENTAKNKTKETKIIRFTKKKIMREVRMARVLAEDVAFSGKIKYLSFHLENSIKLENTC